MYKMKEFDPSKLSKLDLERAKESQLIRNLADIVALLHVRGVCSSCKVPDTQRERLTNNVIISLNTRKRALQFLHDAQFLFHSNFSDEANPGANESDVAFHTRRLHLISSVIRDLGGNENPDSVDGNLVVTAVDAYLGNSIFDIDGFQLAQEALKSRKV